MLPSSKIDMTS